MFEKFTADARDVVVRAQTTARSTLSRAIDSRHLLLALLERDGTAPAALRRVGVDPAAFALSLSTEIGGLDADALATVGIDLDAVRRQADAVFGEGALDRGRRAPRQGHLPFTVDAKAALELALREAVRLRTHRIDGRALFLGLLRGTGSPAEVALRRAVAAAGADVDTLRAAAEGPQAA